MSGAVTAPGQDPSMEDILASIRKILNEDEAASTVASVPAPAQVIQVDSLPLDLTEEMLVAPPPAAPEPAPTPPRPVVTQTEVVSVPQPAPDPGLVAPATAAAAAALIGQLARTVAAERTAPVHRGGPSIEDVVREEIRPLLKDWMDAHLPTLMERLVRAEIERVVSRSLG
jgi:cell pole-organizing protein PopZ